MLVPSLAAPMAGDELLRMVKVVSANNGSERILNQLSQLSPFTFVCVFLRSPKKIGYCVEYWKILFKKVNTYIVSCPLPLPPRLSIILFFIEMDEDLNKPISRKRISLKLQ